MSIQNVTSKDPRKAGAVEHLKRVSGGSKVTMLHHDNERRRFIAHVLGRNPKSRRGFLSLGWFAVGEDGLGAARYESLEAARNAQ